jgi:plasmid stabilization system protein ParE
MTTLILTDEALGDLERLVDFLRVARPEHADETLPIVLDGLRLLEAHPEVGRMTDEGLRELMISRGRTGYVALYVFDEIGDEVWVLAVRHQREAGFGPAP